MDLEDWELLPNINNNNFKNLDLDQESATETPQKSIETDYFIYPSQESLEKPELKVDPTTNLFQVPITWEPVSITEETDQKKTPPDPDFLEPDPDLLTGSAYNKFADMKLDTEEKSTTSGLTRKDSGLKGGFGEDDLMKKKEIDWVKDEKLSLWKLGFNGIGAICSFGVAAAAASICVFFLGHNNNNNNFRGCRNKNQILRFQIYSDENKRMNEVVNRPTKLNEAISVIKGLPVARAQISFGGYYDGL